MMILKKPPAHYEKLHGLIVQYNETNEHDHVQKLYYLQKAMREIYQVFGGVDRHLFSWLNRAGKDSWNEHLKGYSISPFAPFFLQDFLFADTVIKHNPVPNTVPSLEENYLYKLLEKRDEVLKKDGPFDSYKEGYINVCAQLNYLAGRNQNIKDKIELHRASLEEATPKINAILDKECNIPDGVIFKTSKLGTHSNNNSNFLVTIYNQGGQQHKEDVEKEHEQKQWQKQWQKQQFIFRVNSNESLGCDPELWTHPVSRLFIEEYALFNCGFQIKNGEPESKDTPPIFRPAALSQLAEQGDLEKVAADLLSKTHLDIAKETISYFTELTDLCTQLINAGFYHPDIKLTNFLVDGNKVLISDRKTILKTDKPKANQILTSPGYAPPEWLKSWDFRLRVQKSSKQIDLPKFMAYQLGMALKEFLILTQKNIKPDNFMANPVFDAAKCFDAPSDQIKNLSDLALELTRPDPANRLSIDKVKGLLAAALVQDNNAFQKSLEDEIPSEKLGIVNEQEEIKVLIEGRLEKNDFLTRANALFKKALYRPSKEPRLIENLEKIAIDCIQINSPASDFKKYSDTIENALETQDWNNAPWYRKVLHNLSFGWWEIDRNPNPDFSKLEIVQLDSLKELCCHLKFISSFDALISDKIKDEIKDDKKKNHLILFLESNVEKISLQYLKENREMSNTIIKQLLTNPKKSDSISNEASTNSFYGTAISCAGSVLNILSDNVWQLSEGLFKTKPSAATSTATAPGQKFKPCTLTLLSGDGTFSKVKVHPECKKPRPAITPETFVSPQNQ